MCGISEGVFHASRWPSECTLVGVHDTFLFLIWTGRENSSWTRDPVLFKRGSHFEVQQVMSRCHATDNPGQINTGRQMKAQTCCSNRDHGGSPEVDQVPIGPVSATTALWSNSVGLVCKTCIPVKSAVTRGSEEAHPDRESRSTCTVRLNRHRTYIATVCWEPSYNK